MQMRALAGLFDRISIVVPIIERPPGAGQSALAGPGMSVLPLAPLCRRLSLRRLLFVPWLLFNLPRMIRGFLRADAVHAPIPGDIGTIGMVMAQLFHKPLFVRYCGNFQWIRTRAERFWRWFMERFAGGRTVVLATGSDEQRPSVKNPRIKWVFSTTLTDSDLEKRCRPRRLSTDRTLRLISVCRQEPKKGTALVIEALPLIRKHCRVHLDVVGSGSALPALQNLAERVAEGSVTFHGQKSRAEVLELMEAADIFCFPTSSSEGFPKAPLEAMACGLPLVATPVSALETMLAQGAGVQVDKASGLVVAQAVIELADPSTYEKASKSAVDFARAHSLECWQDAIRQILVETWGAVGKGHLVNMSSPPLS